MAELFTLWCRSLQFSIDDTNEKTLTLNHKVTNISNQKSEADRKCRDAVKDHREAVASPSRGLTTEEFGSIDVFCSLFERHEDLLRWFDVDFAATENNSVPLERILQELRSDVKDKERQLKQVENASADPTEKARQINNKNIELKGYIKDIEILNNFEGSARQLERLEAGLIYEVDEIDRLQSLVEVLQKDVASASSELENTCRLLDAKKADNSNYSTLFDRLQRLGQLQPKLLVSGDGSKKKNTLMSPDELVKRA